MVPSGGDTSGLAAGPETDAAKAAIIDDCLARIDALSADELATFEQLCWRTRPGRTAAAGVLTSLLGVEAVGFAPLAATAPRATRAVAGFVARRYSSTDGQLTAIQCVAMVDACVAVLFRERVDAAGDRLYRTLVEPVAQTVGWGCFRLPASP